MIFCLTADLSGRKPITLSFELRRQRDKKVAVSASRPMICSVQHNFHHTTYFYGTKALGIGLSSAMPNCTVKNELVWLLMIHHTPS
ncbi:MAG: hypothetical protein M3Q33_14595, partial [Acidobacteriota bacterium]|nr:hypothetical protein [Acidobacteriota bacterium]